MECHDHKTEQCIEIFATVLLCFGAVMLSSNSA